jgi:autotransporter-associated beta strand protein
MSVTNSGGNKVLRLQDGAASAIYSGDISVLDGTVGDFDVAAESGGVLTLSGDISGTGAAGVSKEGAGTVVLSGTNTYTGATTVNAGALQVGHGGLGQTGTGNVTVNSGGTLLGTGSIRGTNFTADAGTTVQAGDGVTPSDFGTLTFTPATGGGTYSLGGSVVLGLGTSTNFGNIDSQFGDPANMIGTSGYLAYINDASRSQGTGTGSHDLLNFSNAGNNAAYNVDFLSSGGTLQVVAGTGFSAAFGQIFNLLDWSSLSGGTITPNFGSFSVGTNFRDGSGDDLDAFDLPTLTGGLLWDVSQFTSSGIIVVVPEPSRALFLLMGLSVGLLRRFRLR